MERAEHHMAGERGINRDLGRFEVADLANKNDVWILPEKRPQRGREVQADLIAHVDLIDAEQIEFNRILGGHDVRVRLVDLRYRRIKRVRLATAGRSGYQDHAIRLDDGA